MAWDERLARLREKEQDLFQRKQAAFAAFQDARFRAEKIAELKARREAWKQSSQKGWTELLHGTIEDCEVTFKLGLGKNQGQTLIADGLIETEDEFRGKGGQRNHDHYGPDSKYGDGAKRIEEIRKYLSRYTGPGH